MFMSLLVVGNIAYDTIARVKFLPNRNQATSIENIILSNGCLLYTSDAADE